VIVSVVRVVNPSAAGRPLSEFGRNKTIEAFARAICSAKVSHTIQVGVPHRPTNSIAPWSTGVIWTTGFPVDAKSVRPNPGFPFCVKVLKTF